MKIVDGTRLPTVTDTQIFGFFGEYRFLSNFWIREVQVKDIIYPTSEHAYMAYKTNNVELKKYISRLGTPREAREFGQTIELRSDWEIFKYVAMQDVLTAKFSHYMMKDMLLSTQDKYLEESNNWGDKIWGKVWNDTGPVEGNNMLGETLMVVRDRLRATK